MQNLSSLVLLRGVVSVGRHMMATESSPTFKASYHTYDSDGIHVEAVVVSVPGSGEFDKTPLACCLPRVSVSPT
jgi:hypothetical protein